MSYQEAMEAAGATVHEFREFGSSQGDWIARVTFAGTTGYASGSYGSCSACDSFEAEFGYADDGCEDHRWNPVSGCAGCKAQAATFRGKLAIFGRTYLDDIASAETIRARFVDQAKWDTDAVANLEWMDQEHPQG